MINNKDLEIVKRFKELVSQKVTIHELRVFGSRARGDATDESDLDVLIVVDHLEHSIERYISDCAWEAGFPDDVVVVPIPISIDAIKNSPIRESIFIKNVYHEGIAL
jgi:predicted nucleotidyltransferase